MELTRNEMSEYSQLAWDFEGAYTVAYNGIFSATRMDGSQTTLWAATPAGLRERIRDDYAEWQASRRKRSPA